VTDAAVSHGVLLRSWAWLIRFGFRLLYNELAWSYDLVSWLVSLGEWRAWQQAALPFVRGQRVLEIGHGPGHMMVSLRDAGFQVTGLDVSPAMGRLAQRHWLQAPTEAAMQPGLVRAAVQAPPFATGVFDTVLATFPTDYIIDPAALTAVHRLLTGDGRFVIIPEGHLIGRGWLQRLVDGLFRITGQRSGPFDADGAGLRTAATLLLTSRFQAAGFMLTVEQVRRPRSVVTVVLAHKQAADFANTHLNDYD
jgi:SAM-dependent methyltransferase